MQTETGLKDYCATSRPSVHNCIRHDNVLFFTAINTMAPVGLLLCIVCLDLPGKQAVEETAIFLRQKYCFESKTSHCTVSEVKGTSPFCHAISLVAGKFGRSVFSGRSGPLHTSGVILTFTA